jgi:dUTP pyrophosphatase
MTKYILSKNDFKKMMDIGTLPLLDIFSDEQIQPNGLELTLDSIWKFKSAGIMGVNRELPEFEELKFDDRGFIDLPAGSYKIKFRERVKIPDDYFAMARPRSSLLRMGATISTALWDSGYMGRSEALLTIFNPHGLKLEKNTRMLQLIFFPLGEGVEETYNGKYQLENMDGEE